MEKLTIWLFFLGNLLHLHSQDFPPLHESLRSRYLQDFFFLDSLAGGGIPVARIREKGCNHPYYIHQTCPAASNFSGSHLWEWSDGTVHLGFHFFTFALELDYLHQTHQNDAQTLQVLKSGFQALERLEKVAAVHHSTGISPGFVARDDAQFSTLHRWNKKGCVKSQHLCDVFQGRKNAMSQDQLIYLVWGLDAVAFAAKESDRLPNDTLPLALRALFWKHRLLDRAMAHEWQMVDEEGQKVKIGHQMWFWAWPLIRHSSSPKKSKTTLPQWFLWQGLMQLPYLPKTPIHHEVNLAMQLVLSSMEGRVRPQSLALAKAAEMEIFPASAWWKMKIEAPFPLWNSLDSLVKTIPAEGPNYLHEKVPNGWRGENRWFHPNRNQGVHYEKDGRFNGLDAMSLLLIHTLLSPKNESK